MFRICTGNNTNIKKTSTKLYKYIRIQIFIETKKKHTNVQENKEKIYKRLGNTKKTIQTFVKQKHEKQNKRLGNHKKNKQMFRISQLS